jgi:hypothetical protein
MNNTKVLTIDYNHAIEVSFIKPQFRHRKICRDHWFAIHFWRAD